MHGAEPSGSTDRWRWRHQRSGDDASAKGGRTRLDFYRWRQPVQAIRRSRAPPVNIASTGPRRAVQSKPAPHQDRMLCWGAVARAVFKAAPVRRPGRTARSRAAVDPRPQRCTRCLVGRGDGGEHPSRAFEPNVRVELPPMETQNPYNLIPYMSLPFRQSHPERPSKH